jgi:hypothetical protein
LAWFHLTDGSPLIFKMSYKAVGIKTETVSVAKKHYEDLAMMIYEERVAMPMIPILLEEMSELKIMKGNRVDHPAKNLKT